MRDKLFALLGIESGEESMVTMLLMQSVFIGIFFGAFDISAHSLFLSIFDEKMMAKGYVVSGIAGIILTSLYTWFQTRMQFKNFAVLNLVIVTALTVLLWIALSISPEKWIVFVVFIMLGPLNILAMLGFWGTAGRLFSLRQGKRLFGLVDAGLIIGIILSCYTIPVLLSFEFKSHNILLLGAFSVFIATVIQIVVGSRFRLVSAAVEQLEESPREKKSILTVFREERYTRVMALFIVLSVMTAFFVQYSFMAVTREQYPAEADMARFLGIFTGSMMIFTLLVKLLVFSYLIRNYGLKTCLAVSPVLLAAFTAIAILIGLLMGYTPDSISGFLIFFLLLALSRLFSKSLKDSIESPSFKVIYQTIDERIRYAVQSGMDGTVNEIAALSSGLLLAGLGVLSFIKLIHFSFVLFFLILLWILFAFKLYTEYRKSIRRALETVGISSVDNMQFNQDNRVRKRFSAEQEFRKDYFRLIAGDYSPVENNTNSFYFERIIDLSFSGQDINLVPVLRKISSRPDLDEKIRRKAGDYAGLIESKAKGSKNGDDRNSEARKILAGNRMPQTTEILRLLRDSSVESKRYAIYMIGKFKLTDLLPEVCGCINIPGLEKDAVSVLSTFGNTAANELMRFSLASSGNLNTSRIIIRLLGKSCTPETTNFLFSRLWSNSRQIRETALECLIDCDYRASGEDKDHLHQLISDTIGIMSWNLSAKICLDKSNDKYLAAILKKEMERWNRYLFDLLTITYDSGSIKKIKENLDRETVESVNYALEMMDIVIDDSIKQKLIALVDVVSDEDKLKNLNQFYPGSVPEYNKLIEAILNRDYNLLNLWTKACTIRNLKEIKGDDMAESVTALLFSPEPVLYEEAARLIARSAGTIYNSVSLRLPESLRNRLDRIVGGETEDTDLLFEKNLFMTNIFPGISEEELLPLAGSLISSKSVNVTEDIFNDRCIIWSILPDNKPGGEIIVILNGKNGELQGRFQPAALNSFYLLPISAVEDYLNRFPSNSDEILKYIDNNEE
jgi:ATP:ADP antiporter, AAA family